MLLEKADARLDMFLLSSLSCLWVPMSEQVTTGFLFLVNGEGQMISRWIHLVCSELCMMHSRLQ